jgi:signal transduction histidine kinase/CheY-like chemotaxis protein
LPKKTNSKRGRPGRRKVQAANGSSSPSSTAASGKDYDVRVLWELLDGLHVGVANVLPSGKVLYANTRFLESLGIPQHRDPFGVQLNDYVAPSCWEAMYDALGRAVQVPVDGEFQVAAVGENPRTIRLSLGPVCTEQGPTVRIVATEVTELVETNRALRETEASLRSLSARILQLQDQERRRIARDLHDTTGQELAVIVMSLKHLSNSLDQPGFDARKAIVEVSELARQVNDEIRTLSYLLHPPLLDEFGLGSALKWYVEGFNKRSGIDVALEVSDKLPRFASDKETALFRVVQESLTNVMRHSGSRKAWIRVTQNREVVQVGVEDEGSGIDAGVLARLTFGAKALGVGIPGLRERLRQLGGSLDISSSSAGTRLVAVLPAESAAGTELVSRSAKASAAEASGTTVVHGTRTRILVVDDHELMRRGIRALLDDQPDLEICGEARNGMEALEKTGKLEPDLIIMDLSMPGSGGLSAANNIRRSGSPAKILVFTNQLLPGIERMVRAAGCNGLVLKAFAGRDLLKGIRALLAGDRFYSGEAKAQTA